MVVMISEDPISVGIPVWQKMVEDAGGRYIGVQQSFTLNALGEEPVVCFLAPFSQTPIRVRISDMTDENVRALMDKPSKPKLPKTRVHQLLNTIRQCADQIEEELKNV